eukprot:760789-Hanusia_phi.AAC.4
MKIKSPICSWSTLIASKGRVSNWVKFTFSLGDCYLCLICLIPSSDYETKGALKILESKLLAAYKLSSRQTGHPEVKYTLSN